MPSVQNTDEQIREFFSEKHKEYEAFDRTLNALASLKYVCSFVTDIADETLICNFRPRLKPATATSEPFTPDAIIRQNRGVSFLIELKTSWNKQDVEQIAKYAKSPGTLRNDGSVEPFDKHHCIILGYQNTPGEPELNSLFARLAKDGIGFHLVVIRYSLEIGPEGNRMYFVRVPSAKNGTCPKSSLGKAFNSVRGFPVSAESFKFVRGGFHKANDRIIPSYAGVLWWTVYAKYYLNDEQKAQMAERGRLESPLIVPVDSLDNVPIPETIEVPFTAKDVRNALEFLRQAKLVLLKKRKKYYEIRLRSDKRIRAPQVSSLLGGVAEQDIANRILALWATYKVRDPIKECSRKGAGAQQRRRTKDSRTGFLPFSGEG